MDFAHLLTDTYAVVALSVAMLALIYLAIYYGLTFLKIGLKSKKYAPVDDESEDDMQFAEGCPSTTVVMVAHNNAQSMREHMPNILVQNVYDYEIIVVDYHSVDDTNFVIQVCSADYPNLKCISMQNDVNFFQGKKYPLSMGIRSATGEVVLLTDPDCEPIHYSWVQHMAEPFTNSNIQMVLGVTRLRTKHNLLGALQQYHNMAYSCSFLSSALMGHPYTGMGTNMALRRSFFFEKNGFINHYIEPAGADDIFVNRNATKTNTAVCLDPKAAVTTEGAFSFFTWRYQRRQMYSTRCYYSMMQRLRLVLRPLMVMVFYLACVAMFLLPSVPWVIPVALLLLKVVWQIVCVGYAQSLFALRNYHWFAPLLELYFVFSNTFLSIISLHPKRCNP